MAQVKVAVLEIDGTELGFAQERILDSSDCFFDPLTSNLTSADSASALRELSARHLALVQSANALFSTTNTSAAAPSIVTDTSITPEAGEYLCHAYSLVSHSQNTGSIFMSLYFDGEVVANTLGQLANTAAALVNFRRSWAASAILTFNGSQAVDIRARVSGGTGSVFNRYVTLTRIK